MSSEKIVTLRVTDRGMEVVSGAVAAPTEPATVQESDIKAPRWPHWYQRKLARLWYAVLLSMNIEPTMAARKALKQYQPDRYQTYRERLDIAKTLAGWDLEVYEDHLREGDEAGEKYVALVDFYDFAADLGWQDLKPMREGLKIDTAPARPFSTRQKNNYLILMNEVLTLLDGYDENKHDENAPIIMKWLESQEMRVPVDLRTLKGWLAEMQDALAAFDDRKKKEAGRNVFSKPKT